MRTGESVVYWGSPGQAGEVGRSASYMVNKSGELLGTTLWASGPVDKLDHNLTLAFHQFSPKARALGFQINPVRC